MRFTLQFKVFIAVMLLLVVLFGLGVNQYFQARTMEAQNKFDMAVMQRDQQVASGVQKVIETIKKLSITPTPTPLFRKTVK